MNPTLAALVIHDLKNSLGVLEEQLLALEAEPSTELARQAKNNCVELRSRFVGFLLLYGGDGELRAVVSDESPADFLSQQVALAQLNANKLTELDDLSQAPPFWYFDPRLVRLALDAALHNAWRFARSSVRLSLRLENNYLVFAVDDDGPGLDAEDDEDEDSATGLGSELCLAVAQAHDSKGRRGFTRLENRPEGGARFELWLP
jgi:signal transduction histidine kinase